MGLSTMMLAQAGINILISILQFIFIQNDPAEMGLEPYGGKDHAVEKKAKSTGSFIKFSV